MRVIKSSGKSEEFSPRKIYKGIMKAGGSRKLAKHTVDHVKSKLGEGMETEKILDVILSHLKKETDVAARYDLKRAIMSLGPSGFPFEVYFASILKEYGYDAKASNYVQGKNVLHEVDVIAKKKKTYMIECKYHNHTGKYTGLKEAMYTHARFLDIKKNRFDFSWLATNTHCSGDAIKYSNGVKQKITSWKYPKGESLKELIEKKSLYPITIIRNIDEHTKLKLYAAKIMVAKDLKKYSLEDLHKKTGISQKALKKIIAEACSICKCELPKI